MKRCKKFVSLLLALCMAVSLMPVTALADVVQLGTYLQNFPWGHIFYVRTAEPANVYVATISGDDITALSAIIEQDLLTEIDENGTFFPVGSVHVRAEYLVDADIPSSISKNVHTVSFGDCPNLNRATIPGSIRYVSFSDAENLSSLTLRAGVESLEITYNEGLTSLTLPDGMSKVDLSKCVNLSSLYVQNGMGEIRIFSCDNLRDIYYDGTMREWSRIHSDIDVADRTKVTVHCRDGAARLGDPELNELGLSFFSDPLSMQVGDSREMILLGTGYAFIEAEEDYVWTTSNENVCTVSDGWVTAVGPGTAVITCIGTVVSENTPYPLTGMATCTVIVEGTGTNTPSRIDFYPNGGRIVSIRGFDAGEIAPGSMTAQENGIFVDQYSGVGMMMTAEDGRLDSFPVVEREGYTLEGWYIAPNSAQVGADYTLPVLSGYTKASLSTQYSIDVCLAAKWTKASETCTVTFHLNGLSGETPDPQVVSVGQPVRLPELTLSQGYRFVGWGYSEDGNTLKLWDPERPVTSDLHLYAMWEQVKTAVARLNGTEYSTLQEAVDLVEDGGVIEILSNESMSASVGRDVSFTLRPGGNGVDRAGHAVITAGEGYAFEVTFDISTGEVLYEVFRNNIIYGGPAESKTFFIDIPVNHWGSEAIQWAVDNGITSGISDTSFGPDQTCTRAQAMTFLWRAAGSPEPSSSNSFRDVSPDAWYASAVHWAVENGITGGTGPDTFSPDAVCSRGQIMTFLWRAQNSPESGGSGRFSDVSDSAYYGKAVHWAVGAGITSGTSDSTFSPNADCTRAQIMAFLYQCYKV